MAIHVYFLTWTTYGTWLRGDPRGSVVEENRFGSPYANPDPGLVRGDAARRSCGAFILSSKVRPTIEETIRSVCEHRGWILHAVNVRSNHVHAVVEADAPADRAMAALKAWSTRRLREYSLVTPDQKIWTKHGSTRHIFDEGSLIKAIDYVARHQDMKGER